MTGDKSRAVLRKDQNGLSAAVEKEGLLLHPEVAKRWEEIGVDNAPTRIFDMAKNEGDRRYTLKIVGIIMGFFITAVFAGLCFYMVYKGQAIEAVATVVGSLATLFVAVGLSERKKKK